MSSRSLTTARHVLGNGGPRLHPVGVVNGDPPLLASGRDAAFLRARPTSSAHGWGCARIGTIAGGSGWRPVAGASRSRVVVAAVAGGRWEAEARRGSRPASAPSASWDRPVNARAPRGGLDELSRRSSDRDAGVGFCRSLFLSCRCAGMNASWVVHRFLPPHCLVLGVKPSRCGHASPQVQCVPAGPRAIRASFRSWNAIFLRKPPAIRQKLNERCGLAIRP